MNDTILSSCNVSKVRRTGPQNHLQNENKSAIRIIKNSNTNSKIKWFFKLSHEKKEQGFYPFPKAAGFILIWSEKQNRWLLTKLADNKVKIKKKRENICILCWRHASLFIKAYSKHVIREQGPIFIYSSPLLPPKNYSGSHNMLGAFQRVTSGISMAQKTKMWQGSKSDKTRWHLLP